MIPQPPPHPARVVRTGADPDGAGRTRAGLAALTAVVLALSLSGCDLRFESSPGSLPELSGVAAVRDMAARSESAAAARADSLSAKATACEECRKVLDTVSADSSARLEALGGLWDPWDGATPEGAEAPAPVADAPMQPQEFATWLALSATRDLRAVTDTDIEGADARLVASAALGRLVSAHELAAAYGVDLDDGIEQVTLLDTRLARLLGQEDTSGTGWGLGDLLDAAQSGDDALVGTAAGQAGADDPYQEGTDADQQSGTSSPISESADLQASTELSAAVRTWDCVAQMLPRAQVVDKSIDDASARADRLLTRATATLDAGVADTREERCRLSTSDVPTLDSLVLSADLDLFTSESQSVRAYGTTLVTDDIDTWSTSGDAAPGPLPGTSTH